MRIFALAAAIAALATAFVAPAGARIATNGIQVNGIDSNAAAPNGWRLDGRGAGGAAVPAPAPGLRAITLPSGQTVPAE